MQSIGLQRLRSFFLADNCELSRSPEIENERAYKNPECYIIDIKADFIRMKQPLERFIEYPKRNCEQQKTLKKGGKIIEFSMPIGMILISRHCSDPNRKKSQKNRKKIERRFSSERDKSERTRKQTSGHFCRNKHERNEDRDPCRTDCRASCVFHQIKKRRRYSILPLSSFVFRSCARGRT